MPEEAEAVVSGVHSSDRETVPRKPKVDNHDDPQLTPLIGRDGVDCGATELVPARSLPSAEYRAPSAEPYNTVNAPYVSGRRSRKNCQTFRTSLIWSRSSSAVTNSVLSRLPCATNCPRGSQK